MDMDLLIGVKPVRSATEYVRELRCELWNTATNNNATLQPSKKEKYREQEP